MLQHVAVTSVSSQRAAIAFEFPNMAHWTLLKRLLRYDDLTYREIILRAISAG